MAKGTGPVQPTLRDRNQQFVIGKHGRFKNLPLAADTQKRASAPLRHSPVKKTGPLGPGPKFAGVGGADDHLREGNGYELNVANPGGWVATKFARSTPITMNSHTLRTDADRHASHEFADGQRATPGPTTAAKWRAQTSAHLVPLSIFRKLSPDGRRAASPGLPVIDAVWPHVGR